MADQQERQQRGSSAVPAAAAALAAAGLGYADVKSATVPVSGAADLAKGAAAAHAAVLEGVSRRVLDAVGALLDQRYPLDAGRVDLGEIRSRSAAFEEASAARVQAGLRKAAREKTRDQLLSELDDQIRSQTDPGRRAVLQGRRAAVASGPDPREEAARAVMARESRLAEEHVKAQLARAYGAGQQAMLERTSPRGAYWQLGEGVKEHTRDCLMAAGVVFPHAVLREWQPPVHNGCQCRLISVDEALRTGLIGEVTDPRLAVRIARQARALSEEQADAILAAEELRRRGVLSEFEWMEDLHPRLSNGRFKDKASVLGIGRVPGKGFRLLGSAGGSTGAQWASRVGHQRPWLVKSYGGDRDRIATELLSNAIYREMGAAVPPAYATHVLRDPDFRKIPDVETGEPSLIPLRGPDDRPAAGMVVFEPDGRVWTFEPKDHFGGYERSFPKGGLEKGLTTQQNAHRELFEETGLSARIVGWAGDFPGDTSTTRFYAAVRTGGSPVPGTETAGVQLSAPNQVWPKLRARDRSALEAALKVPRPVVPPEELPRERVPALTSEQIDAKPIPYVFHDGEPSPDLGRHFMTDALLANWDVAGLEDDNVLWDAGGVPYRVDQGGTLEFRAQGGRKDFGPVPLEVSSMLKGAGQGRRSMLVDEAGMRSQAGEIEQRLTPSRIDALVDQAGFEDASMRERVRKNLKARVAWMGRFSRGEVDEPLKEEGFLAEALGPSVFSWDPNLHPRDQYGKFRKTIWGLLPGKSVFLDAKTKVIRNKDGSGYRVIRNDNPARGFVNPTDAARYAFDASARSGDKDSLGGPTKFKDFNDFLAKEGYDPSDPTKFGGLEMTSLGDWDSAISALTARANGLKDQASKDKSYARTRNVILARLAEAKAKREEFASIVGTQGPDAAAAPSVPSGPPALYQLDLKPGDKVQFKKGGWTHVVNNVNDDGSVSLDSGKGVKTYSGLAAPVKVTKGDGSSVALKPDAVAPAPKLVKDLPTGATFKKNGDEWEVTKGAGPGGWFEYKKIGGASSLPVGKKVAKKQAEFNVPIDFVDSYDLSPGEPLSPSSSGPGVDVPPTHSVPSWFDGSPLSVGDTFHTDSGDARITSLGNDGGEYTLVNPDGSLGTYVEPFSNEDASYAINSEFWTKTASAEKHPNDMSHDELVAKIQSEVLPISPGYGKPVGQLDPGVAFTLGPGSDPSGSVWAVDGPTSGMFVPVKDLKTGVVKHVSMDEQVTGMSSASSTYVLLAQHHAPSWSPPEVPSKLRDLPVGSTFTSKAGHTKFKVVQNDGPGGQFRYQSQDAFGQSFTSPWDEMDADLSTYGSYSLPGQVAWAPPEVPEKVGDLPAGATFTTVDDSTWKILKNEGPGGEISYAKVSPEGTITSAVQSQSWSRGTSSLDTLKSYDVSGGTAAAPKPSKPIKGMQANTLAPDGGKLALNKLHVVPGDVVQYKKGGWKYTVQSVSATGSVSVVGPTGVKKTWGGYAAPAFIQKADGSALKSKEDAAGAWQPPAHPTKTNELPVGSTLTADGTTWQVVKNEGPGGVFEYVGIGGLMKGKTVTANHDDLGSSLEGHWEGYTTPPGSGHWQPPAQPEKVHDLPVGATWTSSSGQVYQVLQNEGPGGKFSFQKLGGGTKTQQPWSASPTQNMHLSSGGGTGLKYSLPGSASLDDVKAKLKADPSGSLTYANMESLPDGAVFETPDGKLGVLKKSEPAYTGYLSAYNVKTGQKFEPHATNYPPYKYSDDPQVMKDAAALLSKAQAQSASPAAVPSGSSADSSNPPGWQHLPWGTEAQSLLNGWQSTNGTILSHESLNSLRYYTASGYKVINPALRKSSGAVLDPDVAQHISNLDQAFQRVEPTKQDIYVTRRTNFPSWAENAHKGKAIGDDGFLSTSTNPDTWAGEVELRIKVPAGSRVLYANATPEYSSHMSEYEVTLRRGSLFKVLKRYTKPNSTHTTLWVELLP